MTTAMPTGAIEKKLPHIAESVCIDNFACVKALGLDRSFHREAFTQAKLSMQIELAIATHQLSLCYAELFNFIQCTLLILNSLQSLKLSHSGVV